MLIFGIWNSSIIQKLAERDIFSKFMIESPSTTNKMVVVKNKCMNSKKFMRAKSPYQVLYLVISTQVVLYFYLFALPLQSKEARRVLHYSTY